jgi:hypothetical protein
VFHVVGELSDTSLGYGLDDRGLESRQGLEIFLFTTLSRPVLGPTQPPIQWIPGALSLGVKRERREADHSPPSSSEVKNAWSYTSTPPTPSWRGAELKHRNDDTFNFYNIDLCSEGTLFESRLCYWISEFILGLLENTQEN